MREVKEEGRKKSRLCTQPSRHTDSSLRDSEYRTQLRVPAVLKLMDLNELDIQDHLRNKHL